MNHGTETESPLGNREIQIAEHLADIDPVFVPLAARLSRPPYKDISSPQEFVRGTEKLEVKDLIAVHLTDTFPENGIIHPAVYYDPDFLRFTTHFTINSVEEKIPLWGWSWENKKYAVLIPLDKIKHRILEFHPGETFLLEDLVLPEGTIVLKDKNNTDPAGKSGKAKVIEADFSQKGERLNGFHRTVYEQMIEMGYFPARSNKHGWNSPQWDTEGMSVLRQFCQENNMHFNPGLHAEHWTGRLEQVSLDLAQARENNDEMQFREIVERAKEMFFENEDFWFNQKVPPKYKKALLELIQDCQQIFQAEIELPDLPPDEAEKQAKEKITNLAKEEGYLTHTTPLEMLPAILREGVISHQFAEQKLRSFLPEEFGAAAQRNIESLEEHLGMRSEGRNLISVYDLQRLSGEPTMQGIFKSHGEALFTGDLMLLISNKIRGKSTNRASDTFLYGKEVAEIFIRRRIPPRMFNGITAKREYLQRPAVELGKTILRKEEDPKRSASYMYYDEYNATRQRFLKKNLW